MQDSSQNPYIPQESEQIRKQVYERQSPLGRVVKFSLISTIAVSLLVGVGLFFVIPRTATVDQEAREKLANILQPPAQTLKRVVVESEMGFKFMYDNNVYSSYAEVGDSTSGTDESTAIISGERYDNNELRIKRAYNYVRIRPIESVETARTLATLPPELEVFATVTANDLEEASKNNENKDLTKINLFIKLDTDKRLEKKVADDGTIVDIDVSNTVATKIGNVDYQRVRFTTTNENHRVVNVKYDECYYTIQDDTPYSLCISGVRPTNVSAASLVEKVMSSFTFHSVGADRESEQDAEKAAYTLPTIRLAQAIKDTESTDEDNDDRPGTEETADMSPLFTVTPEYYKDEATLTSIAKNQPSVVRIGTIYCADLTLKYQSGEVASTLTDACTGSVSSGSIISRDGYVATTGHAIRASKKAAINGYINAGVNQDAMIDRLQRVLDYLLKSELLMESDADYILQGARLGDQEALAKIENITSVIPDNFITSVKESYIYAVQPSDKAIVVNRTDTNKPTFAYSDSILPAKYIASNYDAAAASKRLAFTDATPANDVGLLKIDSNSEFQFAPLASVDNAKADDVLTIVGYSAYTDSSLTIAKIRNMPIVVPNKVEQAYEKDGTKLIQTDAPVLPGSGGAPVLNSQGQIAGFASYGFAYCPGQQCFASGTVRSSSELLKLLDDSNITLNVSHKTTENWREGVDQYFKANYAASTGAFVSAGNGYAFNRWAAPLGDLSKSNQGNQSDTSLMNQLQGIMIVALIVLIAATMILSIAFVIHRKRLRYLQVGHYGVQQTQPVITGPSVNAVPTQNQSTAPQQPSVPDLRQLPPMQQPYYGQPQQQTPPQDQPSVPPQQTQMPPSQNLPSQRPEDPFYK